MGSGRVGKGVLPGSLSLGNMVAVARVGPRVQVLPTPLVFVGVPGVTPAASVALGGSVRGTVVGGVCPAGVALGMTSDLPVVLHETPLAARDGRRSNG
jgi:hypothetical protein